jgi:hypothetical protein
MAQHAAQHRANGRLVVDDGDEWRELHLSPGHLTLTAAPV